MTDLQVYMPSVCGGFDDLTFDEFMGGVAVSISEDYNVDDRDFHLSHLLMVDRLDVEDVIENEDGFVVGSVPNSDSELVLYAPDGEIAGVMSRSRVLMLEDFKGMGLSQMLIISQALMNDGVANVDMETGYSPSGYYSHLSAYKALKSIELEFIGFSPAV